MEQLAILNYRFEEFLLVFFASSREQISIVYHNIKISDFNTFTEQKKYFQLNSFKLQKKH